MNPVIERLDISWLEENINPASADSLVLFDIDSTIMDTAPRNFGILEAAEKEFSYLAGVTEKVRHKDIGWNFSDAVHRLFPLKEVEKRELQEFWADRFFYDDWLDLDTPYNGVGELLNWLVRKRFRLVYLTGRDEINMKRGTIDSFRAHGLPIGEMTEFLFKPSQAIEDLAFKQDAFRKIRTMGTLVLAVENEPANANAMARHFPDALVALIDTVTAPDPAVPDPGILLFKSY